MQEMVLLFKAFNPAITNTFNWTLEWSTANANNTLTSNFGVLQKLF